MSKAKDPKRIKAGKRSRTKGKSYENSIAKVLNRWAELPDNKEGSFQRRWSGRAEQQKGGDLLKPDWFPFMVELRKRKTINFKGLLEPESEITKWWLELKEKNDWELMLLIFAQDYDKNYVMVGPDEASIFERVYGGMPHYHVHISPLGLKVFTLNSFIDLCDPEPFKVGMG